MPPISFFPPRAPLLLHLSLLLPSVSGATTLSSSPPQASWPRCLDLATATSAKRLDLAAKGLLLPSPSVVASVRGSSDYDICEKGWIWQLKASCSPPQASCPRCLDPAIAASTKWLDLAAEG
ncbi:hypothetical protein BDA96_09G178500 [Sorghum bicolor]|uniref:Gnk2-homologous domain-containing protein n=2 Tax=Sorghum bicolor TaxID=4558 RepID=A0A921U5G5_SORBI|nr:hypothetical protein BDA96_09G178500 [Sorghum bicolor]OQU78163.1 hypothetical protein SORBI_3009G169050 [Sorghum bicolor]